LLTIAGLWVYRPHHVLTRPGGPFRYDEPNLVRRYNWAGLPIHYRVAPLPKWRLWGSPSADANGTLYELDRETMAFSMIAVALTFGGLAFLFSRHP
jgi:hypothetical protein